MQQWTLIKPQDVRDYLTDNQVNFLKNLKKNEEDLDTWITYSILNIAAHVQAEIKGAYRGSIPTKEGFIPQSLKRSTLSLVIEALQTRCPQLGLTTDQRHTIERAHQHLQRIASGEILLEEVAKQNPVGNIAVVKRRKAIAQFRHF